jgi:iron-sulfur cluster assembly protein
MLECGGDVRKRSQLVAEQTKGSTMLTLTETATTAVKSIVDRNPTLVEGGLRIDSGPDGGNSFGVAIVPEPQPGDTTVESGGARVFLEQNASRILEDKVLDAQVGRDGDVTFALGAQE